VMRALCSRIPAGAQSPPIATGSCQARWRARSRSIGSWQRCSMADVSEHEVQEAVSIQRYLLFVEYKGDQFCGSQRQSPGVVTVQEACEDALDAAFKEVLDHAA
jgi:hypothetical protein